MIHTTKIYILLAIGLLSLFSCTDFQEIDLSCERIVVTLPKDSAVITSTITSFWWEEVDGADMYEITIVRPSFDAAEELVLRSSVTETTYDTTLTSGTYQWTLVGKNSAYETIADTFTLFVVTDSSADLTTKAVLLTSPDDGTTTNETDITFTWNEVEQADTYTFQIASPDFSDSDNILLNEVTDKEELTATLSDGDYEWRVRAENLISVSPYAKRSLIVDTSGPSIPVLQLPTDGSTVPLPVDLSWTSDASAVLDSVYVYSDSTSAPILQVGTTATTYSFDNNNFTSYFWRVRSIDAGGNKSGFSSWRKFFIQ